MGNKQLNKKKKISKMTTYKIPKNNGTNGSKNLYLLISEEYLFTYIITYYNFKLL